MKRTLFIRVLILLVLITAVSPACRQNQAEAPLPDATAVVRVESILEPTTEPTAEPTITPSPEPMVQFSGDGLQAIFQSDFPLDDMPPDEPITIYFSEPMNSAHNRPLIFSPTIGGTFSWNSDNTILTFIPAPAFNSGRSYTMSVNASLTSSEGEKLRQSSTGAYKCVLCQP